MDKSKYKGSNIVISNHLLKNPGKGGAPHKDKSSVDVEIVCHIRGWDEKLDLPHKDSDSEVRWRINTSRLRV